MSTKFIGWIVMLRAISVTISDREIQIHMIEVDKLKCFHAPRVHAIISLVGTKYSFHFQFPYSVNLQPNKFLRTLGQSQPSMRNSLLP